MENQGFEGEQQQPRSRETPVFLQESRHDPRHNFPDSSVLNSADSHVYEDILPGVGDVSEHTGVPSDRNVGGSRQSMDVVDYISEEAGTRSLSREEIDGVFRRNLTLPFRRGTGLDPFTANSSVRLTNRKRNTAGCAEDAELARWNASLVVDDAFSSPEVAARIQATTLHTECRPNRRRRKKDCKHCRNKAASFANTRNQEVDEKESDAVLRRNRDNEQQQRLRASNCNDPQTILDPRTFATILTCSPIGQPDEVPVTSSDSFSVFTISEKINPPASTTKLIENDRKQSCVDLVNSTENNEDNVSIVTNKTKAGMRVNSIYSQDRWYAKEAPIFFTNINEHSSFQRAYSLPLRAQTPSSQNRINLRRSMRGEPPPHPARLRKHRHGWTLHLAHPLESSGCTRSLFLPLIALLLLLGIGGVALYIAFVPEKLQIIQQYLKSATNDSWSDEAVTAATFPQQRNDQQPNESSLLTSTLAASSILLNSDRSFPESGAPLTSEAETEASSPSSLNSTRYCDDCLPEEVCVALVDEEAPTCRIPLDPEDPTGCAGFCLINRQKCHRLDIDAFRCVEVEHYCLDDEWTCLNTLCIPLDKLCDGHMNCYDHSDEYDCVCDLETHFQCGNETSCLPLEKRCDGKIDCWDAADEINCTLACPSENEFTCSNGQCILKARFCDGLPDCLDGSDEPHGCQGRCNKHEFTCQNSRCITKGMKCNGADDCGDGSDERHCKDRLS